MGMSEKWRDYLMLIPAAAIYFGLSPFTGEGKAFAVAVIFGVFYVVISRNWDKRHEAKFWIVIASFAVIHAVAFLVLKIPHLRAGLIAFPFALVDALLLYALVSWVDKRFPRKRDDFKQSD